MSECDETQTRGEFCRVRSYKQICETVDTSEAATFKLLLEKAKTHAHFFCARASTTPLQPSARTRNINMSLSDQRARRKLQEDAFLSSPLLGRFVQELPLVFRREVAVHLDDTDLRRLADVLPRHMVMTALSLKLPVPPPVLDKHIDEALGVLYKEAKSGFFRQSANCSSTS